MDNVWEVVKVLENGLELVVAGDLSQDLAQVLAAHFEVGCLEGESVFIRQDPEHQVN